jgi:hypothetical protein
VVLHFLPEIAKQHDQPRRTVLVDEELDAVGCNGISRSATATATASASAAKRSSDVLDLRRRERIDDLLCRHPTGNHVDFVTGTCVLVFAEVLTEQSRTIRWRKGVLVALLFVGS